MKKYSIIIFAAMLLSAWSSFAQTAVYPGALSSRQNLKVSVNGVATLLTQDISSSTSIFTVSSCAGIVPYVLITIDTEIMNVTGCSGTTMVVAGRGFDSTVPAVHTSSSVIYAYVDAWHHNGLAVEIEAIEAALGVNLSNVAQSGSAQTFSQVTATTGGMQSTNATGYSYTALQPGTGGGYYANLSGGGSLFTGSTTASSMMHLTDSAGACTLSSGSGLVCTGTQALLTTSSPTFAGLTITGGGVTFNGLTVNGQILTAPVTGSIISPIFNADVAGYTGNTFQNSDGSFGITNQGIFNGQQVFATNTAIASGPAGRFFCGQTSPLLTCGEAVLAFNMTPRSSSVNTYSFVGTGNGNNSMLLADNLGQCTVGTLVGGIACTVAGNPVGPSFTPLATQTFSALPSCNAAHFGSTGAVSDSSTNTWGAVISGSGGNPVLAFCNGSSWTVAAK